MEVCGGENDFATIKQHWPIFFDVYHKEYTSGNALSHLESPCLGLLSLLSSLLVPFPSWCWQKEGPNWLETLMLTLTPIQQYLMQITKEI